MNSSPHQRVPLTALAERARDGDREAFSALVRETLPWVRGFIRRICRDASLAEELAQETYVKVWMSLKKLREAAYFKSWLGRIAMNITLKEKKRKRPERDLQGEGETQPEPIDRKRPDKSTLDREARGLLDGALQSLPERRRMAFFLRVSEGLSHSEIAEILGTTVGTSRLYVCRAREQLARILAPHKDLLEALEAAS